MDKKYYLNQIMQIFFLVSVCAIHFVLAIYVPIFQEHPLISLIVIFLVLGYLMYRFFGFHFISLPNEEPEKYLSLSYKSQLIDGFFVVFNLNIFFNYGTSFENELTLNQILSTSIGTGLVVFFIPFMSRFAARRVIAKKLKDQSK